ncbi:LOW QUALITY PROTEIN: Pol protein [Phytophthora palmivora]|uniref:Pol protein n=1 Tax=Phytophthora palmivora TaxID=4796 RepID=A0A2P4Y7L1_9STRA|nr:LOW QUALITY PROTEIN: Pol protein [Phytophthora palmivora]
MDRGEFPHLAVAYFESAGKWRSSLKEMPSEARPLLRQPSRPNASRRSRRMSKGSLHLCRECRGCKPRDAVLAASLVVNPLPEHIKVTVFMDGLKVDPSRTQLFPEAIQIALPEEYSNRQARTPTSVWQGHNASTGAVQGAPATGASAGPVPMELGTAVQCSICCYGCGSSGTCNVSAQREGKGSYLLNLGARETSEAATQEPGEQGSPVGGRPTGGDLSPHGRSADGAHHGGLAPESLGALETRAGLLVVHASVRGYGDPFRILTDSVASTNFARRQTVARNGDKYADALRESEGRGQVSVRLAAGTVVSVPGVRMDLAVKFEDFDSTVSFLVLDMDKYDLILSMPRPAVSDRALVSNVPTSVRDWGARDGRQGAFAPEYVLGVADSNEDAAMSLATGHKTKAHCQACGIATSASPNAESCHAVWALIVAVPDGTDQAGNIGPQATEAAEESAKGVSCVGSIGPQVGNIDPQAVGEDAESAFGVGNIVPRRVEETEMIESAACVFSVGNEVPHGVKKTSTRVEVSLNSFRADNKAPHSKSETPPARPVEDQYHVFDGMSGRQVKAGAVQMEALPEVSALLNLEELSMKDFLAELKAGEIAEMVVLKPETSPEDLKSSSVMNEDVLEGFTKQCATRLGSEILKNPEDPVYPLMKEYSDVVSKHPSSQLPPDRGVRHEIDLVPGTKYFEVGHGASLHSTPTFYVQKSNGKWRLVHAYDKLNNTTEPAPTPILRKDVFLNNMSGCTLYSVLDLVGRYYQILMRESDIPLTAVSTPSGMLWEWPAMPQGLSNAPATFNRLIAQLFRPLRTFVQTYFDGIFVHSRAEGGQTAMELYTNIYKCVFAAEEINVLACFVSRVGIRADPGKVKALADPEHQEAFDSIRASLQQAPVLALPDENKSFSVVCDASDYVIGCALLQKDDQGRKRLISFQSRQLKAAERNYPVHDKGLLAMKYALVKFSVHLLGTRPFVIYTNHASLRTAANPPHLSQRLSFFAEYNFRMVSRRETRRESDAFKARLEGRCPEERRRLGTEHRDFLAGDRDTDADFADKHGSTPAAPATPKRSPTPAKACNPPPSDVQGEPERVPRDAGAPPRPPMGKKAAFLAMMEEAHSSPDEQQGAGPSEEDGDDDELDEATIAESQRKAQYKLLTKQRMQEAVATLPRDWKATTESWRPMTRAEVAVLAQDT